MGFAAQHTRPIVMSTHGMISSGHPLASLAGIEVLKRGGNAMDAAVTASAVLSVVDPSASGVGGDLFFLCYEASSGRTASLNGSGRSPAAASTERFRSGIPLTGPLAATVPGLVKGWDDGLERFGTISLADALAPAIGYAEDGFPLSLHVWRSFKRRLSLLSECAEVLRIFGRSGEPPAPGEILRLPDLAKSLRLIADEGSSAFYEGRIADALVRGQKSAGGLLTHADLTSHKSQWDQPLAAGYRGYQIQVQQPVSMGALLLQQLKIVEGYDIAALGWDSPERLHLLIEAKKTSFADLDLYLTDPAFSGSAASYVTEQRAAKYRTQIDRSVARAGYGGAFAAEATDTTYLCVVDGDGNAVSWIQSVFNEFGSCWIAPDTGFFLNNRMCGFSIEPDHVNRLEPAKRTAHTLLAPMVFKDDKPILVLGTPGDYGQTQSNLQMITNFVDFGMDVQQVVEAPRWRSIRGNEVSMELGFAESSYAGLSERGHVLGRLARFSTIMGGAQAIYLDRVNGVMHGAADPRREGYALGW